MRFIAAALIALLAATAAAAAITITALTGRVMSGGTAAAGVTVTVTSPALQQPRTATTNADGFYWLEALPPGTYEVSFSRAGLSSLIRPALLELGRIARADAQLEPSEDEESVTSTAIPMRVADDPEVTSHFDDAELDRLPLSLDRVSAALLAPGRLQGPVSVDDVQLDRLPFLGYESVEQLTVFRGHREAIVARTRSGGEDFSLSVRDTYFAHEGHLFETASGGRIIPERLWFFASGWGGVDDGFVVKLTTETLTGSLVHAGDDTAGGLRYTAYYNGRTTVDALLSEDSAARVSHLFGNHLLALDAGRDEVFLSDRWSTARFAVHGGMQHRDGDTSARIAAIYDVRGNGRQALTGSVGDELVSAGFLTAIGSTGTARVDYLRREGGGEMQLDVRYSLFARLFTGGSYTYADEHRGNAFVSTQLPLGEHELGMTLLERYEQRAWATDAALRYTIPFNKFGLTVAGDLTNALASERVEARSWRLWARIRL
ncbi:MAG TPA: carboxypeptidase-like regulatory domain-containing protein [Thermoanaerobaculia bacterium]|jgi:hypothetical protein